ncbi:MAG: HAMP domain-containing protein [Moraxellaceae bacterium]|nr:HAMP domain-containing protein [Moraxellaceae bacterium]
MAIQQASQRIAQGEFDVRLTNTRHDEIGDVMHNLNTMALELQQLDTNRRHWIANISHELRTPLSVLRGETEAMLDGVRPLTLQAIQSLHEDILCLGRLVDDLHLLSMADVGAFPCYITQVDVKTALNHTLERFKPKAERQQMHVIINNKLPNTCDAQWDYTRIEQLLNNVLDNSLLYSDKKGMIEISLYLDEPHQLKIVIEDSPPHVPDEALTQIFNPLFRLDRARTRQSTGSGLGLAICSAIVKAHHGNIWAAAKNMAD